MLRRALLLCLIAALPLSLAACGDDGDDSATATTRADATAKPETVPTFTSQDLCTRLPATAVAASTQLSVQLAVPIDESKASGCAYAVQAVDGKSHRVEVAVQRPVQDLNRRVGMAAYEQVVEIFRPRSRNVEEIIGVGDAATWLTRGDARLLVALYDDQVITVQGSGFEQEQAVALAGEMHSAVK